MKPRLEYFSVAPQLLKAQATLNTAVEESGLERSLLHLIKLRASQINGCSYCVDMHSHEAREDGETEQRLYLVAAWRESPLFSERERAALAWTETVTLISNGGVSDELYCDTRAVLRRGSGETDSGGCRHQHLESAMRILPFDPSDAKGGVKSPHWPPNPQRRCAAARSVCRPLVLRRP